MYSAKHHTPGRRMSWDNRPLFVETSEGWINLARIWHVRRGRKVAHLWLDGENDVKLPIDEWLGIHGQMASTGPLLFK
jgi:hypothetical protein